MVKQKTRDYEALVAGMRHRPTIYDMDAEMAKGFYSKPPDYRTARSLALSGASRRT